MSSRRHRFYDQRRTPALIMSVLLSDEIHAENQLIKIKNDSDGMTFRQLYDSMMFVRDDIPVCFQLTEMRTGSISGMLPVLCSRSDVKHMRINNSEKIRTDVVSIRNELHNQLMMNPDDRAEMICDGFRRIILHVVFTIDSKNVITSMGLIIA